jgi:hypothetical protein
MPLARVMRSGDSLASATAETTRASAPRLAAETSSAG